MQVAVAVVSWNTRDLLADALASLHADAESGLAEVWVHDNASADGSAAMVAREFPWVRLIASETNLGFGAAVNAVAERATAPWLACANADIVVHPGALAALVAAGDADARAGVLAPRLILPDGSGQHSAHPFPGLGSALALNLGLGEILPGLATRLTLDGHWDQTRSRRVDWAHGAFLLLRRAAFDAIGGFDPAQFLYAEDLDIAWRLARSGWHTRYVAEARVDHVAAAAIRQLYGEDRDLAAQRSAYAWLLRRRGPALMRAVALVNTLGAGARALLATLSASRRRGDLAARGRAGQLRRYTRMHLDGLLRPQRVFREHR